MCAAMNVKMFSDLNISLGLFHNIFSWEVLKKKEERSEGQLMFKQFLLGDQ